MSGGWAKALLAIFQSLYAAFTLYHTRGTQLKQYGYAAFGLTVAQYIVMSILNLLGLVLTPDYDAMYMVSKDVMQEAEKRGYRFDGVVGKYVGKENHRSDTPYCMNVEGSIKNPILTVTRGRSNDPIFTNAEHGEAAETRLCRSSPLFSA